MNRNELISVLPENSPLIPDLQAGEDFITITSTSGALQAAATYWHNIYHDQALYFNFYLQDDDGGQLLVQKLTKLAKQASKRSLVYKQQRPINDNLSFLQSHEFINFRTTYLATYKRQELPRKIVLTNDHFLSWQAVQENSELTRKLLVKSFVNYRNTHVANPVNEAMLTQWAKPALTDLIYAAPLLLVADGEIKSYSFLYAIGSQLELGWVWGESRSALIELFKTQLSWLPAQFTELSIEFDSTDENAMLIKQFLPQKDGPIVESFIKYLY